MPWSAHCSNATRKSLSVIAAALNFKSEVIRSEGGAYLDRKCGSGGAKAWEDGETAGTPGKWAFEIA